MTKVNRVKTLTIWVCVYQIWCLYIIFKAMNADKWLWPIFGCKVGQSVHIGMKLELRAVEFKFLAWSSIAQSVCQQAFSLLVNRYLRSWVRILPSAEEDNLSPFDSNIACLCQSIEINNNKFGCKVGQSVHIGMKLDLDVWHHPLDVYAKFQSDISQHVQKKVRKTFRWLGALVTPPFKCFCPPEGQKLPNHD